MTPQEQQMLQGLIDRVSHTQLPEKDAEAESLLQTTLGANPDALYILAQTVLVQQYALGQAQKQLADARAEADQLRQQAATPAKHTSFLGALLGRDDDAPRQPPPPLPPPYGAQQQPGYVPVPSYTSPNPSYGSPYSQPGYAAPPLGGQYGAQPGGFLRSAMQTATGVAAGALAFDGIESLMHGFGHAAGYGGGFGSPGFGGGFGESGPREEVTNNYYGDQAPGAGHAGGDGGQSSAFIPNLDSSSTGSGNDIWSTPSPDAGTQTVDSSQFADSTDTTTQDDSSGFDDSSNQGGFDDSSADDSGAGFDDPSGGGFDDGGGGGFDGGDNS